MYTRLLSGVLACLMAVTPVAGLASESTIDISPVVETVTIEPIASTIPEPVVEEPEVEEVVEQPSEPVKTEKPEEPKMSKKDIELIALVTMAEAEGESELGKRLVIDTILNRIDSDKWPDTAHGVIYQKAQFSSMWNGRVDRCYVRDDIVQLVEEELEDRTNSECVFFQMYRYSPYGTDLFKEGCHYFSAV